MFHLALWTVLYCLYILVAVEFPYWGLIKFFTIQYYQVKGTICMPTPIYLSICQGFQLQRSILLTRPVCFLGGSAGSLFENEWSLKPEYKRGGNRLELADRLASRILWIGIANLLLCPVILVWQILYAFFSYTEVSASHAHVNRIPYLFSFSAL